MPDINTLITRAKKGDRNAFGEIYRQYLRRIYRFVYYFLGDSNLAEDLSQDTFIRAWRALPNFREERGTLQAFLFAIARNLVIDYQRKRKATALDDKVLAIRSEENVEGEYVVKEERKKAKAALARLAPDEKEVVLLRFFEELSYKEIAQITKENEGAVRVKVFRILKKLREYLKDHEYQKI